MTNAIVRDQVLFTVSKHVKDLPLENRSRGVLGAWFAGRGDGRQHSIFDPQRIAVVIGTAHGVIVGAYDTIEDENGDTWGYEPDPKEPSRQRVRFHDPKQLSAEFEHLIGQRSPVTWARGQRTPVQVRDLQEIRDLYAGVEPVQGEDGTGQRAQVGAALVTASPDGSVLVEVPAGISVTVRTTGPADEGRL